jgi:hypothetical protein
LNVKELIISTVMNMNNKLPRYPLSFCPQQE